MRRESTPAEELQTGLRFLYRPGSSSSAPLVILIHGRAGDRGVMWTFERCIPPSFGVVSFEGFLQDPIGGWSWWHMTPEGSRRDAIRRATAELGSAVKAFEAMLSLTPMCSLAIGFSQGAVLVSHAALSGAVPCNGIALLAGFALLPHEGVMRGQLGSVFVAHGTSDETIPVTRARESVAQLEALTIPVHYVEERVGHKVGIEGTRGLTRWISGFTPRDD